jgi:RNA polymerase sigma-70 factor (ECF subfamily)
MKSGSEYLTRLPIPTETDGSKSRSERALNDCELVKLVKLNDQDAFAELCRRYENRLFRTAARILRNKEDAEDAVQESLSRAFWKIDSFRGHSLVSTWLTSIAVNTCLMHLRRRRSRPECSLDDHSGEDGAGGLQWTVRDPRADIEGACLAGERRRLVKEAIAGLPATLRIPLETHLSLDCSLAEVASRHKLSVSATKSRLLRARVAVRDACSV